MGFAGSTRFELLREIGRGGMGIVYAAYDRDRDTEVALKTVAEINPASIFRIKREFRGLAGVSHPNLVSLFELGCDSGQWYFTMELVHGEDILSHVLGAQPKSNARPLRALDGWRRRPKGDLPATKVLDQTPTVVDVPGARTSPTETTAAVPIRDQRAPGNEARMRQAFFQLVEGVSALHASGHLHRDIKPSNVLVTPDGRVVLLDFGVITELRQLVSHAGEVPAGTPAYMAPEQADITCTVTEASDWYSVGVILYEALTGLRPFRGTHARILLDKRSRMPVPPQARQPDAPADLCELCVALLHPDPGRRPSAEEIKIALAASGDLRPTSAIAPIAPPAPTFVGRDFELETMRTAFAAAKQGIGNMLFVSGRSGMGKSSLVRRFLDEVRNDPSAVVLEGRCYPRESVPYKAVDSVVDALCVFLLGLPDHEAELLLPRDVQMLARVFPVLNRVDPVLRAKQRGSAAPDPHEVKRRAFRALRELLGRLAERHPVVLFIDDLQWGDADSAPLLESLMRPPDQPPLLLLACYRSEERERSTLLRSLLRRDRRGRSRASTPELHIEALAHDEAVTLARTLASDAHLPIDADRLVREAGAHPYFIHELVGHARNDPDDSCDDLTLDGVIARRADKLPADARLVLELIAVAAQPIEQRVVQEAARLEAGGLLAKLQLLESARLVRVSGTRTSDFVEPFHDWIREIVVRELRAETLRHHHRALASALRAAHADPETLAAHYRAAGERPAAAEYAIRAADKAVEALAFEKGADLYRTAIESLGEADEQTLYGLRVKLADALANAGHGRRAAEAYLSAIPGATAADVIELQRRASLQYLRAGHIDEGLDAIGEVLSFMGFSLPKTPRGAILSLAWHRTRLRLRGLGFRPRDESQITAEELCRIDTCWSVALGLVMVDTFRCVDFQTRHLLLALRAGEPFRVSRALALEIGIVALGGNRTRTKTVRIIEETKRLAEQAREPEILGFVEAVTALAQYQTGLFSSARRHATKAISIWRGQCTGVSWELSNAELYRLWSLFYLGDLREMRRRAESLLEEARTRGDLYTAANLCAGIPNLAWLLTGNADEAEAILVEALAKWSRRGFHLQHYWGHFAHAHLELYRGDAEAAFARTNSALRELKRSRILKIQAVRHEAIHLRARCALALASVSAGRKDCLRRAERDARLLVHEGPKVAKALGLLLRAGLAAARGEQDAAAAAFERAEAAATAAELGFYATAARRRRGEVMGGSLGDRLVAEADGWLAGQGVVDPAGIVELFAPGRPYSS